MGAANEEAATRPSYAGLSQASYVLIKGYTNRGSISQMLDHSYSHPTDRGCDVMFIQPLAPGLCQTVERETPAPVLANSWRAEREATKKKKEGGKEFEQCSPAYRFKFSLWSQHSTFKELK